MRESAFLTEIYQCGLNSYNSSSDINLAADTVIDQLSFFLTSGIVPKVTGPDTLVSSLVQYLTAAARSLVISKCPLGINFFKWANRRETPKFKQN